MDLGASCRRLDTDEMRLNKRLRGCVKQAQIDAGNRPGVSSDDRRRLVDLERANRELRRANAILKPHRLSLRRSSTAHRHAREVHGPASPDVPNLDGSKVESQKIRSPGCSCPGEILMPFPAASQLRCAKASRGIPMPICANAAWVKLEQSQTFGPAALMR